MKKIYLFVVLIFLVLNTIAQEKKQVFIKKPKTGLEATIDSIGYKADVALGRAKDKADKQLYKYVTSRFVDEYMANGRLSSYDISVGIAYKLNFPFWEWRNGEANVALFIGVNYGETNLDERLTPNVIGYNINTNFYFMFGHVSYPFKKKKLFIETSVFLGLNTFWTKGNVKIDETYKNKERSFIGGVYSKVGCFVSKRVGIFVNVMLPIRQVNDKYMFSSNSVLINNPETPILFGLGVVIKPKILSNPTKLD